MKKTIGIDRRGTLTLPKPMRRRLALPEDGGILIAQDRRPRASICALAEGLYDFPPEKDRPVLAAAINGNCTHLLTGDYKHFGELVGRESEGGSGCQPVGGAINRRTYNRSLGPS